jgi:hypothetical protein
MGTMWMPEMIALFVKLGRDYRLPIGLTRDMARMGANQATLDAAFAELIPLGHPDLLTYLTTPFSEPTATPERYRQIFAGAEPGLNFGAFHFTKPADMEFFSPDILLRTTEYDMFRDGTARQLIDEAGLELAGLREYRDRMRAR